MELEQDELMLLKEKEKLLISYNEIKPSYLMEKPEWLGLKFCFAMNHG